MKKASIRTAFPLGPGLVYVAVGLFAIACVAETPTRSSDAPEPETTEAARASYDVESADDTIASASDPGERVEPHASEPRSDPPPIRATDKTPLYIVDGGTWNPPDLREFYRLDIESLEVLNETAATERYGSRGTNGAILITTRK